MVQTRHNTERALAHIHERIARFGDLEPDWDSYGAKPISPTAMATAKDVLRAVSQRTTATTGDAAFGVRVTPLLSGGILLEWHGPSAESGSRGHPNRQAGFAVGGASRRDR